MGAHKPIYARKAMIERTIAAAQAAGIKVGGFEVDPDGTIRILAERAGGASVANPDAALDRWLAKQDKAA